MNDRRPTLFRVITWLPVGGIERRLVAVAPRLRDRGWNVRVVCIREEGPLARELRDAGIPLEVIPFPSRFSPPALRRLAATFREHDARVVHSHMYRSNIPASVAGKIAGVPAIFAHIHNVDSWDNWRQAAVDRAISRLRTATIAVSRAVQEDVMAKLGLPEERVPVLYNGINIDEFQPDASLRLRLREEWRVGRDEVLFLVPARLHPQKNLAGVMRTFQQLVEKESSLRAFRLVFAGSGKLEEELRAQAGPLLDRRVMFLGQRDDMPAVYNAADAVILSSFKEGFSNAVVEALAAGKPFIGSDVGGNREAVGDGTGAGWIHAPGDGDALLAQMGEALALGTDGLAAMAGACRTRAQLFSLENLVEQTHQLYVRALGYSP